MLKQVIRPGRGKLLFILPIILFPFLTTLAQETNPDAINGLWQAEQLKIEIFKEGNRYAARTITGSSILEADGKTYRKDVKNPDPNLRNRPLTNYVYITGLTFKEGQWLNGKVYDFTSGRSYDVDLELKEGIMYM